MSDHKKRLGRLFELRKKAHGNERNSFYNLFGAVAECVELGCDGKPERRSVTYSMDVINELYVNQGEICPICMLRIPYGEWQVDHKIPVAYGGGNEISNLQLVHAHCNQEKKDKAHPSDVLRYWESKA